MKSVRKLFIVILIECVAAWQISIVGAEEFTPLLRVGTGDVYLTAGEENRIEVSLKNTGDFDVFEVKTFLSVPLTTPGISILKGAQRVFNEIGAGRTQRFYPTLYVDKDTPLGAYTLSFQVDYIKIYKQGATLHESAVVQVGVVVHNVTKPRVDVDVTIDAPNLKAGGEDTVSVVVENIGEEPVYDLDVRIASMSSHIVVLRDSRFTGDSIPPNSEASFTPTLFVSRTAPLGVYTMTATTSYEDSEGKEYSEAFTLGVNVDEVEVTKQTSIVLSRYGTEPAEIRPGDTFELNVELECSGAEAYEVKASLAFAPGTGLSPITPTLVAMGDMGEGETREADYNLIANGDLSAGQYPGTLTVGYLDMDGVPGRVIESVTISVRGIVEFSLIVDEVAPVEVGGESAVEADLLLIGTESIKFVDIEIVEDAVFEGVAESSEYIGAVDPDSPIPFDLDFGVAEGTEPDEYDLRLKVSYTDDLNKEHDETLELPVTVTEAQSENGSSSSNGGLWNWLRRLFGLSP